ncbi:MAG: hypothetical protein K9L31_00555 [Candidatus Pacebacteria bacterium]|nr:hypothetical protein [Candidatus Paceibacterota bacterium]
MKDVIFGDDREKNKNFYEEVLDFVYNKKSNEWVKIQDKKVVQTFKLAVKSVPAYSDFIKKAKIDPLNINSFNNFQTVPSVNKKNYLRAYKWEDLCKNKYLFSEPLIMTSTSGSTGEPFYFPRTNYIDLQSSVYHQLFIKSSKIPKNTSTLVIDCFGMGVWIGGIITYQAFKHISERGYPMTIITPGISKREIFQAIRNLGPKYNQIILCGYPPFMKDVVDEAKDNGVVWKNYNIKMIFAAESFSETFREYIANKVGIKNIYRDTMNIYGSADLGTMAEETPMSILVRRLALDNPNMYLKLFGQAKRLPTLAQYIPCFNSFDSKNGSLYCTGDNALPLVRYEIGDNGGVLTFDEVSNIFMEEGFDLKKEMKKIGIQDTLTELPFVYVFERSDFSASFYGAIMYPEYIKKGLSENSLSDYITGKFTMYTKNDEKENQYLEINIEMKPNVKSTKIISSQVLKSIHDALLFQSTEYKKLHETLGDRVYPKLVHWPNGHPTHFLSGAKQKWTKNDTK